MPRSDAVHEDDDHRSLSSSTDSDNDSCESYRHAHRACSRHASCNKKTHQHVSIDSTTTNSKKVSNNSKPTKGDIRSVVNEPGHRQKYDGTKWRRICCVPDCLYILNGGIYYDNWLCRKHYLLTVATDMSSDLDDSTIENTRKAKNKKPRKRFTRQSDQIIDPHQRGDVRVLDDGSRQKYDGRTWRPVCNYDDCISFVVRHGYCHRHDLEMRKKNGGIIPSSDNIQREISASESQITRRTSSTKKKPKKGDIQLIRQKWNGSKWYSLCHYYTRDCARRSFGIKYAHLCDVHYKEYQNNRDLINGDDQMLISSIAKRQKLVNDNNTFEEQRPTSQQSGSNDDRIERTEQCIQTDLTYSLDANDLREGYYLIEDDSDDEYLTESAKLMIHIKKEEENYLNNNRKISLKNSMDINSLPMDCKLELTKIEI